MIIGLTGSISSGKSEVVNFLKKNTNWGIIQSDNVAHKLLESPVIIKKITDNFGSTIQNSDGIINREKLGQIVFNDSEKLQQLNNILDKQLKKMINNEITQSLKKHKIVVVELPLLFEQNYESYFDLTLAIDISLEKQLCYLQKRDKIDIIKAQHKINNQLSSHQKSELADLVIINNGTIENLHSKIERFIKIFN